MHRRPLAYEPPNEPDSLPSRRVTLGACVIDWKPLARIMEKCERAGSGSDGLRGPDVAMATTFGGPLLESMLVQAEETAG